MLNIVPGTPDNDILFATDGSDWLQPSTGWDVVHGGLGKDIYTVLIDTQPKYFRDFEDGSDLIDLRGTGISSFEELSFETLSDSKALVTGADGGVSIYIETLGQPLTIDATDFIYERTPFYSYSTDVDVVKPIDNVYFVHLGLADNGTLDLSDMARGPQTRDGGVVVTMDDDMLGNGSFELRGVTQHFFNFQNITGTATKDMITGSQQDNVLAGGGNGDTIYGGDGNDQIFGQSGADILHGDDGNDTLDGGAGRELLYGGAGNDTFIFGGEDNRRDIVMDFENGSDLLDISAWGATSMDDLEVWQLPGGRVWVSMVGSDQSIELRAADHLLSATEVDSSDFIFA